MINFQKRGSLQLSINAIVVLILAITILGLGLGFIKSQFATATENFDVANQQVKTDIVNELKQSGSLLTFKEAEFSIKSGQPYEFYYGIRNTDQQNQARFYVQFYCMASLKNSSGCGNGIFDANGQWQWFETYRKIDIEEQKSKAVYAKLQATSGQETYRGRVVVWKCTGSDCPTSVCYRNPSAAPVADIVDLTTPTEVPAAAGDSCGAPYDGAGSLAEVTKYDSKNIYIKII